MNAKLRYISCSILLAALLALGLALTPARQVQAATCTVTTNGDSGAGSLREKLADATCSTITFAGDMTIYLAGPLALSRNLTIDGGEYNVVISGDTNSDGNGDVQVFSVNAGVNASLQHLTVTRGFVASGSGGGISINDGASLTLSDSTLANNSAGIYGGGIYNSGTLVVTNSTFSSNSAYRGGAIYHSLSTLTVTNSTFAGNNTTDGGSLYIAGGTVTSTNSIFVKGTGDNCYRTPAGANNLADDTSCGAAYYSTSTLLGPLDDYGGPTQTIPLLPGSAAIDAGAAGACPGTDQRGVARVGTCDIGAFEFEPPLVTSDADDGPGTLRRAIRGLAPGGTITFAGDMTIHLAGELDMTRNMTIDGGSYVVILSGDTNQDNIGEVRVLDVWKGVTASLNHLTVTKGYSNGIGGGIYNDGTLTVAHCTFSGNSADEAGGIYNYYHGTLTVTNSTFSGNSADNGGAIENHSTLIVTNSTFYGNRATSGAGIRNFGTLAVTDSTLYGNNANYAGGGIENHSTLTVTNSTFSANHAITGGGVYGHVGGFTTTNSIYANNTGNNCDGAIGSGSNNLVDDTSCGPTYTTYSTSILLGPLGDYGGPTQTVPLLPGSAAIDAGNSTACPETDQRGAVRVGTCDIGAFESQGFTLANLTGTPQSALVNTDFATPLGLTVSSTASGEPVDGGRVTFTAPAEGASATLTGSPATISGGMVSVTAKANSIAGNYNVTATAAGAVSVDFALTNTLPTAITVTSSADSGSGTLRQALLDVAPDGTITFAGDTSIYLASPLTLSRNVTIDGGDHKVAISGDSNNDGSGDVRVFLVNAGVSATLRHLTVTRGYAASSIGGGITINDGARLTLSDSALANNSAGIYGGGIYNSGTLTVTNSTLSGNSAYRGGAVYTSSALTVTNSTFAGNITTDGGNLYIAGGTATSTNSIYVKGTTGNNCYRTPAGSNNLADDTSCGAAYYSTSILLGPLGDYGGPTRTIPLLPGSAAIDAGASASCPAADQRGIARVGTCDIGAFESQGFTLANLTGTPQSALVNSDFGTPLGLAVSPNASGEPVDGGRVTFTAPAEGASATLTGSPATISGGMVSVTAKANSIAGNYNVTATAAGAASASFQLTNTKAASTTSLTSSANPSMYGQAVTLTATVSAASGTPTGTVTFQDGGAAISGCSSVPLSSGRAACALTTFAAGSHSLTALYSGDSSYDASTSSPVTQVVNRGASTTTLTSSPNPSTYGQAVTFMATVSGTSGTPTGTITFYENLPLSTQQKSQGADAESSSNVVPLTNGTATFTTSALAAGSHSILAEYSGDATYEGSKSSAITQVVHSGSITVTSADDSGPGTLRQAMADIGPGGTITFAGDMTIRLASTLIIDRNLTIDGGDHQVVISGDANGNDAGDTGDVQLFIINAGVIATLQHLTVTQGYLVPGNGAGISISGGASLTLNDSALINNNAGSWGGAIYNLGTLVVTDSTFSSNNAYRGGAIYNNQLATLSVTNNTFVGNSAPYGGSVYHYGGGFGSTNNIFVKGAVGQNCYGMPVGSNNLADDYTCGAAYYSTSILLGPLGSYGGPTQSIPLLPGSAAIDAGNSTACSSTDQRGVGRMGTCDIGAFESHKFSLGSLTGTSQSAVVNSDFATPLGLAVSANASGEPVDGGKVIFAAPATGASATLTGSPVTIEGGMVSVTAKANGSTGSYNVTASAAGAASASFLLTNTKTASTTSLASSPNPSSYGETVTFTATVSGSYGTPAGTVTFQDNGTAISACSSVTLSSGQATCALATLAAGSHSLTSLYSGDATYDASTSSAVSQVVRSGSIVVTSAADSGPGTLRQALLDLAPGGTITFAGDMTIYLAGPLTLNRDVTIDGGEYNVVISGDTGNDGTANTYIFYIPMRVTATLSRLTLEKGMVSQDLTRPLGGATFNSGTLTITDSTFSDNSAREGGAIYNSGTLTVTNSTFSGNNAITAGGAIKSTGTLTVTNSTFSGNNSATGGALYSWITSIVRNNVFVKGTTGANCYGSVDGGNNLLDEGTCGPGSINSSTILLGPLGDYGGPTQTFPLLPGSAAIDAGNSAACPETDQRGIARVGTCDIGAFESQGFTLSDPTGSAQSAVVNTAFTNPLGLIVSANASGDPVDGGQVTFTAPASGASTSPAVNVATISGGSVSQPVTANGITGPYLVLASTRGASGTLSYALANGKALAAVTLASSPNPSSYKQRVTFTVTVTGASGTPTGTVTFYENAQGDTSASASGKADAGALAESTGNVVTLTNGVATFTTSSLSVGLHSMVAIYSGDANYDTSTSAPVVQGVSKAPAILTQPSSQTVIEGQEASFSADSIGYPDMAVQWQESPDGKAWTNIDGATTIPLTFTASFSQNGSQYRVTFTNSLGSITSNAATLTVQQPPAITQQPQSTTVNAGETVTFSAAASGSPAPTVQWQQSTDQGLTWIDVSGATSASYSFTASLSMNGSQYRAIFTNAAGSATSDAAILTVSEVTGTASISGLVYHDANGNGVLDRTETGLAGWTVQLFDAGGAWIADMTTDGGGAYNYTFSNLSAGVFRVRLAQPLLAGYIQTTADPADITLANGQAVTGVNFGAVLSADVKVEMTYSYDAVTKVIVYTITVTNDGPADAAGVVVKDTLNTKYVSYVSATSTVGSCSYSKGTVTCNVDTMASGSNATITLIVNRITTRAVTNTASETASTFDIDKADNSASVTVP